MYIWLSSRTRGILAAHIRVHLATSLVGTVPFTFSDRLCEPRPTPLLGRKISTVYPRLSLKDDYRGSSGLLTGVETNW